MDKKQYEVMNMIMTKGRKFLDEIYQLMSNNGLLDEKYCVDFEIVNREDREFDFKCDYLSTIEMRVDYVHDDTKTTWERRMEQWSRDGKGWVIMNDPICESGIVPEDYDSETGSDGSGEESGIHSEGNPEGQNAPSDNGSMWFHDDDGDPPMVCRGDLNDGVVESDPGR